VENDPVSKSDPTGLFSCGDVVQTDVKFDAVIYRMTTFYVCKDTVSLGYIQVRGNPSMGDFQTTYHWTGRQDLYESGGCEDRTTGTSRPCYEVDLMKAWAAQVKAEPCSPSQRFDEPHECEGEFSGTLAGTLLFRALRNAGMAYMSAVYLVGRLGQQIGSAILGVRQNIGVGQIQWQWAGRTRIPDLINEDLRIAYEVKYVADFRVTQQIIDTAAAARLNGYRYVVALYSGSTISEQSKELLRQLGVELIQF